MIPDKHFEYVYLKSCELLLNSGIICLPVNPYDIIKKNHWGLVSYTELCSIVGDASVDSIAEACKSRDGFTVFSGDNYCIAYNDTVRVKSRITFTLMHEAGHIVCRHFSGHTLSRANYLAYENEANFFASNILAPAAVIKACGLNTPELLMAACGISYNAAKARLSNLDFQYIPDIDNKILKAFDSYISICKRRMNAKFADIICDGASI